MTKLYINESSLSQIFWQTIYNHIEKNELVSKYASEIIRISSDIQKKFPKEVAGSISKDSVQELISVSTYFKPKKIIEVGTYIGRSAMSLSCILNDEFENLYTCDSTFDLFSLPVKSLDPVINREGINYFPKTSSTEMLENLVSTGHKETIDLFFFDGRLNPKDVELIQKLMSRRAVFLFDDFEGLEKGVANAFLLKSQFNELVLLRPSLRISKQNKIIAGKTAIMIPQELIVLSRQQEAPISLVI